MLTIRAMQHLAHNTILEPLFSLAETFGIGAHAICDAVGLDLATATMSGGLVPAATIIDALEWTAAASGYPNFGLLLSERVDQRIIGLPALIAEQCRSIREFYDLMQLNLSLHTTGFSMMLDHDASGGVGRLRIYSRGRYEPRHFAEGALAVHARAFRQFLGVQWRPAKILLAHDRLGKASDYARAFGTEVIFSAGQNAIIFTADDLRWRAAGHDAEVRQHLRSQLERVATIDRHDIASKVSTMIRALLPTGEATVEADATALLMTPRTLQRKLAALDTSFSALLAAARTALALDYLSRGAMSATEVASRLGFAEVSVLSRFLRQQLGASPRVLMKGR